MKRKTTHKKEYPNMGGITGTNKNDKRWWHIEERVSGTKSLIIGKRIQINWSRSEDTKFSFKTFNNVDMFYLHIVLFHRYIVFFYYHRL
jgi:hypothetical protein